MVLNPPAIRGWHTSEHVSIMVVGSSYLTPYINQLESSTWWC